MRHHWVAICHITARCHYIPPTKSDIGESTSKLANKARENIQWVAVVWTKIPCCCRGDGQAGLSGEKGHSNSNNDSVHPTYAEYHQCTTRDRATATKDHTRCHSEHGTEATCHTKNKLDNIGYNIQMVGSEIGINNMKAWIFPVVQASGGIIVWGIFSWHTLVPIEHHLKCHSLLESIPNMPCQKAPIITKVVLNMTMSSPSPNDLHSHQISIQLSAFGMWWNGRFASWRRNQ